jgi:hypothetical protein
MYRKMQLRYDAVVRVIDTEVHIFYLLTSKTVYRLSRNFKFSNCDQRLGHDL